MISAPLLSLCFGKSEEEVSNSLSAVVARHPSLFLDGQPKRNSKDQTLIFEGLSFGLQIVKARKPIAAGQTIFLATPLESLATTMAIDFGPHLSGGLHIPALVKAYLELSAILATELEAIAVRVPAANLVCGSQYFIESVTAYVAGGPFPALALISFNVLENGQGFLTAGLKSFAGQELVFEADSLPRSEMMRRVVRLVHDIAVHGPITAPETLPDLDAGNYIEVVPDAERAVVTASLRFGAE